MTLDRFEGLLDNVERQFRRASSQVSIETKQYANRRLTEITPRIERIQRDNAYQDYLLDHIQEEKEKYQLGIEFRDSDEDDAEAFLEGRYYDELREQPVCTCSGKKAHNCPLKRGKLPIEVRQAETIDDGIREFKSVHNGQPLVLVDAQKGFAELVAGVEQDLRELLSVLSSDQIPADPAEVGDQAAEQASD